MALEIHHLTNKDYKVMPWKNGGGSTTELAIFPMDAEVKDGFDWRISLADLEASGPFSQFEGLDRVIVQVSGEPMTLRHPERLQQKLLGRYEPYSFAGEWQTESSLNGRAQDFNVMVKRGALRAEVESLRFDNEAVRKVHSSGVSFIFVAFGSLQVHESSKGHDHRLEVHHALEVRGEMESVLTLKPREVETVAFFVTIR